MTAPMIGIDAGTTNSSIAYWDGSAARIIPMPDGSYMLKSAVAVSGDNILVGQDAIDYSRAHPDDGFRGFKRLMGEPWHDDENQGVRTLRGEDGNVWLRTADGTAYSPQELTSYIITTLLNAAEEYLGARPTEAVIAVPADFGEAQRRATEEAGKLAGLTRVELIHEPTAAALAYGVDSKKVRRLAVYDLGGGTFDVSILQTGKGNIEVKAPLGRRDLGGNDWDQRLVEYVLGEWGKTLGHSDLAASDSAMMLIRDEAEATKIRLSTKQETVFRLDDIDKAPTGEDQDMRFLITQSMFNDLTEDLRNDTLKICQRAVDLIRREDPNFSVADIHDVVLIGGMTRVPAIRDAVATFFGKQPKRNVDPETAVAMGSAIRAAVIEGRKTDATINDVTSHAIAIEAVGGVAAILLKANTPFPMEEPASFTLSNVKPGQGKLAVRVVQGDGHRASACEILAAHDIAIEPGAEKSARVKLYASLDESGRPRIWTDAQTIYGDAP